MRHFGEEVKKTLYKVIGAFLDGLLPKSDKCFDGLSTTGLLLYLIEKTGHPEPV